MPGVLRAILRWDRRGEKGLKKEKSETSRGSHAVIGCASGDPQKKTKPPNENDWGLRRGIGGGEKTPREKEVKKTAF